MLAAARPPRLPNRLELGVRHPRRPRWNLRHQPVERLEEPAPLGVAQAAGPRGIFGNRLTDDGALRLAEPARGLAQAGHGLIVERERDLDHSMAILPYAIRLMLIEDFQ